MAQGIGISDYYNLTSFTPFEHEISLRLSVFMPTFPPSAYK